MARHLQGLKVEEFIRLYWEKKPIFVKQALNEPRSPISAEELAGLACEEDVHSQLIRQRGGGKTWQRKYGPFVENDFLKLPETHYCLQVSECEKWIPEFAELLEQFDFIPSWRIDNVTLGYAAVNGSVGPQEENCGVFLLQLEGQGKWQYNRHQSELAQLVSESGYSTLESFQVEDEVVLTPGDLLYLPPGAAHNGVAITPGLTCFIELRAPTAVEVLESFTLEVDRANIDSGRYADTKLKSDRHRCQITDSDIDGFKGIALDCLKQNNQLWRDAVGKLLSDSVVGSENDTAPPARFEQLCLSDWVLHADSKMLYHADDSQLSVYCNGELYLLPQTEFALETIQHLCTERFIPLTMVEKCKTLEPLELFLVQLVASGALLRDEEI